MKKLLAVLALSLCSAASFAWEPPADKTVTAIVGFAPGSGNELSFRGFSTIVQKNNPKFNYVIHSFFTFLC